MWRRWFPHFVPVVDFLHALSYVFAAAMAGRSFAAGWPVYRRWIQALWAGDVAAVREELAAKRDGGPPAEHRALRDLGYTGWSELLAYCPRPAG